MHNNILTFTQIQRLWRHLSYRRKSQLAALIILMILASLLEVVSVGATLPFLSVLTSPEKLFTDERIQPVVHVLDLKTPEELLLPFTIIFILAVCSSGIFRIALLWSQARLSMAIGIDLNSQAYERTLYQPYSLHVSRNSSEILAGVEKVSALVSALIQPSLQVLVSSFLLTGIILALIAIQPVIAASSLLCLVLIYTIIGVLTRRPIMINSKTIAVQQSKVTKAIQEGLGSIRDTLINGSQPVYCKQYRDSFIPIQKASASIQVMLGGPRYLIECFGTVSIAGLAYYISSINSSAGGLTGAIPVIGSLVLGAQRLLPLLQQIYAAYTTIKGNQVGAQDALDLLDQTVPSYIKKPVLAPICFRRSIKLQDLSFRYSDQESWVIQHLSLEILKGSRVGFMGTTGSGKSTLLDIVTGLLAPTDGSVLIDDKIINSDNIRAWQAHISHVSQAVFLADASVAENIAFGVPKDQIELDRVERAAKQAQISETIERLRNGYDSLIGERGVRLSGGQRQRIGVARALYRRADVIIFDEATSALDNETETALMKSIYSLGRNVTLLIVAHRLTTLEHCDVIVEIASGKVKHVGSYERLLKNVKLNQPDTFKC